MSRVFATLLFTLTSLFLLACASDQEIEQQIAESPIVLEVTAAQLQADYEANDVAADLRYKDKVIAVTGIVASIVSKDSGGASVGLETSNFVEGVRCHFTEQHVQDVAELLEGDWVKLRGQAEGKGLTDLFDVSVRACSLLEHRASEASTASQPIPTPTTPRDSTNTPGSSSSEIQTSMPIPTALPQQPTTSAAPTAILVPIETPMPTPIPLGTALDNPVVAGGLLSGANGTEIVATGVMENAWEVVRAENQFNEAPAEGNRFYLITVEVAYVSGSGSIGVSESDFKLIGDNRVVYRPSCGVIPDELGGEIFVGGRTRGNVCFQIPEGEDGLVLIHQSLFSFEPGDRRFLSLDSLALGSPSALAVVPLATSAPATLASPLGTALDNPVAAGGLLSGANGTEIVVTGVMENAWEVVRAENQSVKGGGKVDHWGGGMVDRQHGGSPLGRQSWRQNQGM